MDYAAYHKNKVAKAKKDGKKEPSKAMTKSWFAARDTNRDQVLTGSETEGLWEADFRRHLGPLGRNDQDANTLEEWNEVRNRSLKPSQRGKTPRYATVMERTDPRDPGRLVLANAKAKDGSRLPVRRKVGYDL